MTEAATSTQASDLARRYFAAIGRRDLDAALACWAPGAIDYLAPVGELRAPDGMRSYFEELFAAMPDFHYEVVDLVAEGDRVAVHWRAGGTFTGRPFQRIRANGARIAAEGLDLVRVVDGLIVRNDSFWDDSAVARQIGLLPRRDSVGERAFKALFNARSRVARSGSRGARRAPTDHDKEEASV
jgi:steroid delta-isomerase-like uncharacterized protein